MCNRLKRYTCGHLEKYSVRCERVNDSVLASLMSQPSRCERLLPPVTPDPSPCRGCASQIENERSLRRRSLSWSVPYLEAASGFPADATSSHEQWPGPRARPQRTFQGLPPTRPPRDFRSSPLEVPLRKTERPIRRQERPPASYKDPRSYVAAQKGIPTLPSRYGRPNVTNYLPMDHPLNKPLPPLPPLGPDDNSFTRRMKRMQRPEQTSNFMMRQPSLAFDTDETPPILPCVPDFLPQYNRPPVSNSRFQTRNPTPAQAAAPASRWYDPAQAAPFWNTDPPDRPQMRMRHKRPTNVRYAGDGIVEEDIYPGRAHSRQEHSITPPFVRARRRQFSNPVGIGRSMAASVEEFSRSLWDRWPSNTRPSDESFSCVDARRVEGRGRHKHGRR